MPPPKEILIEYVRIGAALKIIAVDPETGTEVSFQAPASAGPGEINRLAQRKLAYVIERQGKS